jgi:predicted nucleotidyltransferase
MHELEGENRIEEFRHLAETLVSKIAPFKGVAGIVLIGGLARGFADRYSDVDTIVLLRREDKALREEIWKVGAHLQRQTSIDMDVEVHFLDNFKKHRWSEMTRWDFSHAQIVYDTNGEIKKLLNRKLKVGESFWREHIVVYGEYLKWYCCPPKEDMGTMTETWIERGDLASAHFCLNYSIDLIVRMTFALNKEFLPPPKWMLFYSYNLKWLPDDYRKLFEEALTVKSLSVSDLKRRLKTLRKMWREILPVIRSQTGLTPESISKEYLKKRGLK